VKFLVFVKLYVLLSTMTCARVVGLKLPWHSQVLSAPFSSYFFCFKVLFFRLLTFLLLKGSRLLSTTTCVSIIATFLNLTCLYVLAT
jgi:hypothetical protein